MSGALPPEEAEQHAPYAALRAFALAFPEADEEFPWGHCAIKVRKKIFLSMGVTEEGFSFSIKLTDSNFEALLLPFTEPSHYGMGKHGWVTARFGLDEAPPMAMVFAWIEESYRAIALKSLVKRLDTEGGTADFPRGAPKRKSAKKAKMKAATKKTSKKKAAKKRSTKKESARRKKR